MRDRKYEVLIMVIMVLFMVTEIAGAGVQLITDDEGQIAGGTSWRSSPNYAIVVDALSGGGGGGSSDIPFIIQPVSRGVMRNPNYEVRHTTGQSSAIGESTSPNYKNQAGFWYIMSRLRDTDSDGILDDGDRSGIAGDSPCTGGSTMDCDDNCLETPNSDQADIDSNGVGDVCEPGTGLSQ